ncbi:MAG: hypothetical protein WCI04_03670 [archaeon]
MSLYGPKLRLPKVEIPNPSNPSWNLEKEKKLIIGIVVAVVLIALIVLFGPLLVNGTGEAFGNTLNPAMQISWKNNPVNLKTNPVDSAELTIEFINTTKERMDINFSLIYPNKEILEYCPKYYFEKVSPQDTRSVTCFVKRNGEIYTGTYSIEIKSNLGNTTTKLEIIGK